MNLFGPDKLKVTLVFCFRNKIKRDVDNYPKVVLDAVKNLAFDDDDQIYELTSRKLIIPSKDSEPYVKIRIERFEED